MTDSVVIRVPLGERTYEIVVGHGLLEDAGQRIATACGPGRVAVITDETVAGLHLETLDESLERAGIRCHTAIVPPGETTKSFRHLEDLLDELLDAGIERGDGVVALGGGVIGDLAGLSASLLRRGVALVQIPTTLLAQVDSSVGGKTGIDTRHGKNLIGTFHQPRLVLADTSVLATLPPRERRAGYAEVVKYGLLGNRSFFEWLEDHGESVLSGSAFHLQHAVEKSCAAKAAIVARDEREGSERALLNLGHTFGHALETACGYDGRLLHGEAVAIGMTMAFDLSASLGLCPAGDAARVRRHLARTGLPVHPADLGIGTLDAGELVHHMAQDKKVVGGRVAFVLVHGIGEAFLTRDVALDTVAEFLTSTLARTP
ncbi:MAG: 3-dehydroquinate synthase [bacterium]|nr:3-dehydroquinate synthase [bacterium]